jgi:hypothetical protein
MSKSQQPLQINGSGCVFISIAKVAGADNKQTALINEGISWGASIGGFWGGVAGGTLTIIALSVSGPKGVVNDQVVPTNDKARLNRVILPLNIKQ